MSDKLFRPIVVILLAVLILTQLTSPLIDRAFLETTNAISENCQLALEKANTVVTNQSSVISNLMDDYDKTVYDNPNVDNIYQQTFMSNEFQLAALQVMALQNAALLDITLNCK